MKSCAFYLRLECFSDFKRITDSTIYESIPSSWKVFITDIEGSTQAIEAGRYKEVNTVGAASIVCAQNAMNGEDFPFVFGGDGATLLVPPESVEVVQKELCALQKLSKEKFGLKLRVGRVSVEELKFYQSEVRVAKFEFVKGRSVAVFQGGGLAVAEKLIKSDPEKYSVVIENVPEPDLTGLSCRWQPIPNRKGTVLSMLVMAQNSSNRDVYDRVLAKLSEIFSGQIDEANPVNVEKMQYRSAIQCFRDEKRYHQDRMGPSFLLRCFGILMAVFFFKVKIRSLATKAEAYTKSMRGHSDYRKFDDMLRMVVDCSLEQRAAIEKYLSDLHDEGAIFYGLHESQESLMTCFVHQITDGEHIHFIDGANGGYAMAAKQLKQQIEALVESGVIAA